LFAAGVDLINLSIDTLHRDQHKRITGVDDLPAVLEALAKCVASGVSCKVNTVVMKGVNDREIDSIIAYCEHVGVRSLKLNDVIKDLQDQPMTHAARLLAIEHRTLSDLYYPMNEIVDRLYPRSTSVRTIRQGGLGHPMLMFSLPSGMDVILKDHCTGAWYSTLCEECDSYPCHDALMALRLTADAHLQFCLLRRGTNIDLRPDLDSEDDACLEKTIGSALRVYHDARFEVGDMPTAMNEGYCPLSVPSLRHGGL
jgi:cyclic pyranopterin phosphate synthase